MNRIIKKTSSFKKEGLEIATPLVGLPFMFSVGATLDGYASTSASDRKECIQSPKSQKLKSSFNQELQKLGVSAKSIPDKNPLKIIRVKVNQPEIAVGLPFQRRARSSSPPRDNLRVVERHSSNFFSPRSPIVLSHKIKFKEDFTGLCRESGYFKVEEDDDLKYLKEQYQRLIEETPQTLAGNDSDSIEDEGEIEKIESQFGFKCQRRYFK
jgi:hypothetical protein